MQEAPCPRQPYCDLRDQTETRFISHLTRNTFAIILAGGRGSRLKQLTDFREGNRTNDGDAMIMRSIAAKLSNKDVAAIASYLEGLH